MDMEKVDFNKLSEEEKKELINNLSENLPLLRMKLGMTQEDLAKQLGVTRQTIVGFESGKRMINWSSAITLLTIFAFSKKTAVLLVPLGIVGHNIIKALPFIKSLFNGNKKDTSDSNDS